MFSFEYKSHNHGCLTVHSGLKSFYYCYLYLNDNHIETDFLLSKNFMIMVVWQLTMIKMEFWKINSNNILDFEII